MTGQATLIALDWGTTSLRGYVLDDEGTILDRREGGPGIMKVQDGAFEAALDTFCGDWTRAHPRADLIASGMIGSRQGWAEAPYRACPAGAQDLAGALVVVPLAGSRGLAIVPGVSFIEPRTGVPDVMRGEETQLVGALPDRGAHVALLPGTHSKWAWFDEGRITSFASFMTGEVYAALCDHTILGRLMTPAAAHDDAAFERGVRYGLEAPGALLNRLFSARTLGLFDHISGAALASYLSGLLIGSEIGGACAMSAPPTVVTVLGAPQLSRRYIAALALAGIAGLLGPDDCAARGAARIHATTG